MKLFAGNRRRIVIVKVVVEPVVVPVPLVAVPVEVADHEIAVSVVVLYSAPSCPPPFEFS